jgi:hypothetical protein
MPGGELEQAHLAGVGLLEPEQGDISAPQMPALPGDLHQHLVVAGGWALPAWVGDDDQLGAQAGDSDGLPVAGRCDRPAEVEHRQAGGRVHALRRLHDL